MEGYVDYQRQEFCKDLPCPVQVPLDAAAPDSQEYARVRGICQDNSIHTTYEFHHWLIGMGSLIIRPASSSRE